MRLWLPPFAAAAFSLATSCAETAEAPANAAQIAHAGVVWRRDLRETLQAAAQDGLAVVVVAEGDAGAFFANVLRCPTFNSLADQAHFVLIKLPLADEASEAGRFVNAMRIDPTFSSTVLALRASNGPLTEILRLRGYRDEASLIGGLADAGLAPRRALPLERASVGDESPRDCLK